MKARNLRDLEINNSSHRAGGLVGDIMRKGTAYDVWALDSPAAAAAAAASSSNASGDQDGSGGMISSSLLTSAAQVADVGAEELNGLSILLPSKRKGGKLYLGALRAFHVPRSMPFFFFFVVWPRTVSKRYSFLLFFFY